MKYTILAVVPEPITHGESVYIRTVTDAEFLPSVGHKFMLVGFDRPFVVSEVTHTPPNKGTSWSYEVEVQLDKDYLQNVCFASLHKLFRNERSWKLLSG